MHFFDYISSNSPNETLNVFKRWTNARVRDPEELSEGLHALYQELPPERKQVFMTELAEIHPDREMMEEMFTPEPIESFAGAGGNGHQCNCPYCSVKFGANGQQAVSHFMSNGEVQNLLDNQTQNLNQEISNIKNEVTTDKKMNDKIFKLVIMGVVVYLLYKITKK